MSDFEQPEFIIKVGRNAAKDHRCCECDGVILKGQRYMHITGKWDGDVSTFKQCEECAAIWERLMGLRVEDDFGLGMLSDELEYAHECREERKLADAFIDNARRRGSRRSFKALSLALEEESQ